MIRSRDTQKDSPVHVSEERMKSVRFQSYPEIPEAVWDSISDVNKNVFIILTHFSKAFDTFRQICQGISKHANCYEKLWKILIGLAKS